MSRRSAPALGLSALCVALPAHADGPTWLELSSPPECRASAGALAARVLQGIAGERHPELTAAVAITRAGPSYRVLVTVGERLAREAVTATTCSEAEDTAVAIVTLALGIPRSEREIATAGQGSDESERQGVVEPAESFLSVAAPVRDRAPSSMPSERPGPSRLSLGAGVDGGTLPEPTAYVGTAWTHSRGSFELVGQARYGLPVIEAAESTSRENLRQEFGMLALLACYGAGPTLHVAACAGAELGVVRTARTLQGPDRESAIDMMRPRLGGVVGAVAALRRGTFEPRLEAEAAVAALGREPAVPAVVLRAGAGASVRF